MVLVLVRSNCAYLFRILGKSGFRLFCSDSVSSHCICFNYLTAKHVQGVNEGVEFVYCLQLRQNFAEFGDLPNLNRTGDLYGWKNWYIGASACLL